MLRIMVYLWYILFHVNVLIFLRYIVNFIQVAIKNRLHTLLKFVLKEYPIPVWSISFYITVIIETSNIV